jgi:WD40 repeat protein
MLAHSAASARKLAGHTEALECLAFSKDGKYLASGDWQGVVKVWDTESWLQFASLETSD